MCMGAPTLIHSFSDGAHDDHSNSRCDASASSELNCGQDRILTSFRSKSPAVAVRCVYELGGMVCLFTLVPFVILCWGRFALMNTWFEPRQVVGPLHVSEGPLNAFICERGGKSPPVRFSDLFAPHGTIAASWPSPSRMNVVL